MMLRPVDHRDHREMESELARQGFVLLGAQDRDPRVLASSLGEIIDTTHVVVRPEGRALVTSDRALDLHTDHHRADRIMWHCHVPADEGGETILALVEDVLAPLDGRTRQTLEHIRLTEHCVFPFDVGAWPLLEQTKTGPRLYYSFWLERPVEHEHERKALRDFRDAVARAPRTRLRLERGETLIIDNGRVLHGRTAIRGTRRHLERHWISTRIPRQKENER